MSEKHKKEKELKSFRAFQQNCLECPRSSPTQPAPPAPDIFFTECGLGIEITEYLLAQGKDGSRPKQHEIVHQRITDAAQAIFESKFNHLLQVSVSWTIFTICPSTREEKIISRVIAEMVESKIHQGIKIGTAEAAEFSEPLVHKYGVCLSLYLLSGKGFSCWSSMACFSFPEEAVRIQETLNSKEQKTHIYRKKCQSLWLLITSDRSLFSSSFTLEPDLFNKPFKTSFDRVFLLDEPQNSVYEFNTNRN